MNYLLKNNRREKGVWKKLFFAFTILAVAGLFYFFASRFVNDSLFAVARPIWDAKNYVVEKLAKIFTLVYDKERLVKLNAMLEQELEEAKMVLQSLDAYKKENDTLKSMLGRAGTEKRLLASIMAKPNKSLYDTLLLDVGENQGVALGDKVLAGDFVVGSIREVNTLHSKAILFSSPGEVSSVLIGESNIPAEALGRGAGNFTVKLPKEVDVAPGDLVRLPGLNPKFFGTVSSIEQTVTGSFQFILFRLPTNINNLRWVEIVKND